MSVGSLGRLIGGLCGIALICAACGGTATREKDGNPVTCTPGTKRCDGHEVKRCDDSGTGESVWQSCLSAMCQVQNGVAACAPTACAAGLGVCAGTLATKCKDDGSAPLPGGVDCEDSGKYCVEGQCRDTPCTGGAKSCKDGDVYQCEADGRTLSLAQACTSNEVCSDDLGTCLGRICAPNETTCFDDVVATCNSLGSAWLPERMDCSNQGKICVEGRCLTLGCEPSTPFCRNNKVYLCDEMGVFGHLSEVCDASSEHCETTAAGMYALCAKNDCIAGKTVCDGNTIKVCDSDNTFPADGIDCKANEICEGGKCTPRDCSVLGVPFCKNDDVYECEFGGPTLAHTCDSSTPCQVIADPVISGGKEINSDLVSCVPRSCQPGQIGCLQNQIGSCNSEGVSLSGETTDCAATGEVCTAEMTCAASTTDQVGEEDIGFDLAGNRYVSNVISVQSARKLTELQMRLKLDSAHDLRWVIFEQVGNQLVARAETTAPAPSGAGLASSGALSYQLEVGKRYALGVLLPEDAATQSSSSVPASFGQVIGSAIVDPNLPTSVDLATSFSAASTVYMKVTTEAP